MIITIEDYDGTRSLDSEVPQAETELKELLSRRVDGRNSFWLRLQGAEFPSLNVAFSEDYATVNYFAPQDTDQNDWASQGHIDHLPTGGETTFYYNSIEEAQEMDNFIVVPCESALQAALEFFKAPFIRPNAIDWYAL